MRLRIVQRRACEGRVDGVGGNQRQSAMPHGARRLPTNLRVDAGARLCCGAAAILYSRVILPWRRNTRAALDSLSEPLASANEQVRFARRLKACTAKAFETFELNLPQARTRRSLQTATSASRTL